MKKFIVIVHGWHVSSNGFNVHEIQAEDRAQAEKEGALLCVQRHSTFDNCAYVVVEINELETIKPRKLTLVERITGKITS